MKRFFTVALSVLTFVSFSAKAELVHTDWKTESDQMATLDTESGLEWLKTENTAGMSFNEVDAALNTFLLGWRWATRQEVSDLFASNVSFLSNKFIDDLEKYSDYDDRRMFDETERFVSFLEGTNNLISGTKYFILETIESQELKLMGIYQNWRYDSSTFQFYGNEVNYEEPFSTAGHFLVSDGGTTLSSRLDPTLNINNPDAPINQVSVPFFVGGLALLFIGLRRRV